MEGVRLKPYDDQTGKELTEWNKHATIGVGHLISQDEWKYFKNGITHTDAEYLFTKDLQKYTLCVAQTLKSIPLTVNQKKALICFCYNIGCAAFTRSSVVKILLGQPTTQPTLEVAWKAWNKSAGKINQGLINRRDSEWRLFQKP